MQNEQVVTGTELETADESSFLYNIIGFLIPLIGLTIYFNINEETPIKAKSLGTCSLAGLWVAAIIQFFMILASM